MKLIFSAMLALLLSTAPTLAEVLAFPGAEGFGRFTSGGRGGDVYIVDSLADSGPGTLRECAEASGPRTCVITVDGDVFLDDMIRVTGPDLTIAGQTAPGQGIQLRNGQNLKSGLILFVGNAIIRHVKIRLGPTVVPSSSSNCLLIGDDDGSTPVADSVMIDHVSCAWAVDQLMYTGRSDRVTISDSLFYEGLLRSNHVKGPHSRGPFLIGCGVSMIRNVIASNDMRNPSNACGLGDPAFGRWGTPSGENEFRNNAVYNGWRGFFHYFNPRGESWVNAIGNHMIRGPNTWSRAPRTRKSLRYAFDAFDEADGNISGRTPSGTTNPQHLCLQDTIAEGLAGELNPDDQHILDSTDCVNDPVGEPGATRGLTGPAMPAAQVLAHLTQNAGAIYWNRDAADDRLLQSVNDRTGRVIDHPSQVGGWPVMQQGSYPDDTDQDGIPDQTEVRCLWDPADAFDYADDADGDGYTNLEEHLNHRAEDQVEPCRRVRLVSAQNPLTGQVQGTDVCGGGAALPGQPALSEGVVLAECQAWDGPSASWVRVDFESGSDGWVPETLTVPLPAADY